MKEEIISFVKPMQYLPFSFFIQMTGISHCDGSYKIQRSNSAIYVFEYIIEGEGTVIVDDKKFNPSKGDIYILHKGSNHTYYSSSKNPWTKIWFNIQGDLIQNLMQAYNLENICHIENFDIGSMFYEIFNLPQREVDIQKIMIDASLVFHEMLIKIHDKVRDYDNKSSLAREIRKYIDSNVQNSINLKNISEHVSKSTSQIIRLFKKEYNKTPYDYLMEKRIEQSKLLLKDNTKLSIKEISERLCFADEHYFSTYFKGKVGISPKNYRISY